MCTNRKYIRNQYTGKRMIVPCGKCDACKQAKANHVANRIRSAVPDGFVGIFAGLTYKEKYIPYVKKQDVLNQDLYEIPIYRDFTIRRFKDRIIDKSLSMPIGSIDLVDSDTGEINREDCFFHPNLYQSKTNSFHQEKMGIIYYKDVQDFFKRLRIDVSRRYGYDLPTIRYFVTSEYGEQKFRPHFHILVITERENYERIKSSIVDNWAFEDRNLLERNIEPARNVASYVASYVNCGTDFPKCFSRLAQPKHSCSKNFGVEIPAFRLNKILEKADKGPLCYSRATKINGIPAVFDVPIPKYVINRYFPQFKGLCRLTPDALDIALRFPYSYFRNGKHEGITNYGVDSQGTDDFWKTYIRLVHARDYYCKQTGKTIYDFAIDYQRVLNCYKNTIYRMLFDDVDEPMLQKYDNIEYVVNGTLRNDTLYQLIQDSNKKVVTNFNEFRKQKELTDKLSVSYQRKCKNKRVNNFIYSKFTNL